MKNTPETEYVPFGKEWEQELMKWNKKFLINLLRQTIQEKDRLVKYVEEFKRIVANK